MQVRPTFEPAGAVTGIGSLPLRSVDEAIQKIVEFFPDVPFWPQLPRLSEREIAIRQGLDVIRSFIEPRNGSYGFQIREGEIDAAVELLHSSGGALTQENAAGFFSFEDA